jgi:hypothetical protein
MGVRLLACFATVFLGFALMNSAGAPQLYVSPPLAPVSYRAAAEIPSAIMMTAVVPNGQPDSSYDWRMNEKDWRFQLLAMIPFGLLFIAVSLQNTKRAEDLRGSWRKEMKAEMDEECEILAGMVPPEYCQGTVAMAAVDGQRRP